jgi:hypothetical protein
MATIKLGRAVIFVACDFARSGRGFVFYTAHFSGLERRAETCVITFIMAKGNRSQKKEIKKKKKVQPKAAPATRGGI